MKKITVIVLLTVTFALWNCASPQKRMNESLNKVYVGMSISEFNEIFPKKNLLEMKDGNAIYKVVINPHYGGSSEYRFFYFKDNKLIQVDKGERSVDKRIQIDLNNR